MSETGKGTVTLLLTDMVDSTALWTSHEAPGHVIASCEDQVDEIVCRHNGKPLKHLREGDSTFNTFALPSDAMRAAIEIQETVSQVQLRVAIHTGEVEFRRGDLYGLTVIRCARLRALGHAGQILVSAATKELAHGFDYVYLGEFSLKGFESPSPIYQLAGPTLPKDFPPLVADGHSPSNLPYQPNCHFVGRETLLQKLDEHLLYGRTSRIALVGVGGLGKTQTAIEYAFSRQSLFPGGVFWVHGDAQNRLEADLASLGADLGLSDVMSGADRARAVRKKLASREQASLLIIDDLAENVEPSLPADMGRCRVLMTTKLRWLAKGPYECIDLPVLDAESAVQLLQSYRAASGTEERDSAYSIAERVGFLPLALALVAHHIDRVGITFAEYAQRISSPHGMHSSLEAARRRFQNATGHCGSVFDTLSLSYGTVNAFAQDVLGHLSCYASRGIPRTLPFEVGENWSEPQYDEALADLGDCSLVAFDTDGSITLHQVVGAFAFELLDPERRVDLVRRSATTIARWLQDAVDVGDRTASHKELPHAEVLLGLCRAQGIEQDCIGLVHAIGSSLFESNAFPEALGAFREGLRLAPPSTFTSAEFRKRVAESLQALKLPDEALDEARKALREAGKILGTDDPRLAGFHNSLGYVLKQRAAAVQEDRFFEEAMSHYQQAYDVYERAGLRKELASCLNNMGTLRESQGNLTETLELLHRALEIDREVSGPESEKVAIRLNNIGRTLAKQDKWAEALANHEKAANIYLASQPILSLDAGISLFWKATALAKLGRSGDAEEAIAMALPALQRHYEPDHPIWEKVGAIRESPAIPA